MEITWSKVNVDSLAELAGKTSQKLRTQFKELGLDIPEDDFIDYEIAQIALMELGLDWSQLIPPITTATTQPARSEEMLFTISNLYENIADIELDQYLEYLTTPIDLDDIFRIASFLNANGDYDTEAKLWAAAFNSLRLGILINKNGTANKIRVNYARSKTYSLLSSRQYQYAREMAFAAISCDSDFGSLDRDDDRVIGYLLAILLSENVISDPILCQQSVDDLILTCLESRQVSTIGQFILGIRRALFLYDNFVERLKLSSEARKAFRKSLNDISKSFELNPDFYGEDIYTKLAKEISENINLFKSTIEGFLSVKGYVGLNQYRSRLITRLKGVKPFSTPEESIIIEGVSELLINHLTNLDNIREAGNIKQYGQAHANYQGMINNVITQINEKPSWLTSCFILPTVYKIGNCIAEDFYDRTSQYSTSVSINTLKKEIPLVVGEVHDVILIVKNTGNSIAENVKVEFQPTDDLEIIPTIQTFGTLSIGTTSGEYSFKIKAINEKAVFEIPYKLFWSNVAGDLVSINDVLKILPQKHIDWEIYRKRNPYTISSIKENQPERLKGRTDKLDALRMGLDTTQSYFITGQKRVGKSSIANVYYGELLKLERILPVRIIWGEVADCGLSLLGEAICKFIKEAWQEKTRTDLPYHIPSTSEFEKSFSQSFSEYLRNFHRAFPEWKIVFVIDDFDEIREELYKDQIGDAFFTTLRAFIDKEYTSFLIVGSEKLTTTILREQGQKVNQANTLEVDYLSNRNDLEELIREPAEEILFIEQDAVSEIIDFSAGNPYYASLLCFRIYRLMVSEEDYYVTRSDVLRAANLLAEEDKEKSYDHFWTDGIRDIGPEKERAAFNNAMTLIAVSKGETDADGFVDIKTIFQQPEIRHLETSQLEYRLNELADRKVLERSTMSPSRFRLKVKLFKLWLSKGGAHQVRQSFGQVEYTIRPMHEYAIFPEEINKVAEGLEYRGEKIDRILVETWLRQFGDDYNQRLAFKLLCALKDHGYYSIAKFNLLLQRLLQMAIANTSGWAKVIEKNFSRNILVSHVDPTGKSGPSLVTEFRRENQIYSKLCGSIEDISEILAGKSELSKLLKVNEKWLFIIVDDFVGSGNSGVEYIVKALDVLDSDSPGWENKCHVFYGFVAGFVTGAEVIENATNNRVKVLISSPLEQKDRAFSPEGNIFQDDRERAFAKSLFQKIGMSLEKRHPLGHEDSEALVVFPTNVPNNTLPQFYKQGRHEGKLWTPLFPRV